MNAGSTTGEDTRREMRAVRGSARRNVECRECEREVTFPLRSRMAKREQGDMME